MTGIFKGRRWGMTLVEVLVAGSLFGLFTGMVAGALVMARHSQDASTSKLDGVRSASVALDQLVRDIEVARFEANILINGGQVPQTPVTPDMANELQITRLRHDPTASAEEATDKVIVGYWLDPGRGPGKAMLRRTIYDGDSYPLTPVAGETADGKVLVRDVKRLLVSSKTAGGLTTIKAEIWVSGMGTPVTATVATEAPIPAPAP